MTETARELIERKEQQHGSFEENARIKQALRRTLFRAAQESGALDTMPEAAQTALEEMLLKLARLVSSAKGPVVAKADNARDILGYALLLYESCLKVAPREDDEHWVQGFGQEPTLADKDGSRAVSREVFENVVDGPPADLESDVHSKARDDAALTELRKAFGLVGGPGDLPETERKLLADRLQAALVHVDSDDAISEGICRAYAKASAPRVGDDDRRWIRNTLLSAIRVLMDREDSRDV